MIGEEMFPEMPINPPEPALYMEAVADIWISPLASCDSHIEAMENKGWHLRDEYVENEMYRLTFSIDDIYGDNREDLIDILRKDIDNVFTPELIDVDLTTKVTH